MEKDANKQTKAEQNANRTIQQFEKDTIEISNALREIALRTIRQGDSWERQALCSAQNIDPELFDVSKNNETELRRVQRICGACAVKESCKITGLSEEYLTWGGISEDERRALRKRVMRQKVRQTRR